MLTDLTFLNPGNRWPPPDEISRLQTYEQNLRLFNTDPVPTYPELQRLVKREDYSYTLVAVGFPKRLSTLWADLVLGEPPRFTAPIPEEQQILDALLVSTNLLHEAYKAVIDLSRYGHAVFKLRHDGTRPIIEVIPPGLWFPVASPQNQAEFTAHVLAFTSPDKTVLHAEVHEPGRITYIQAPLKDGTIRPPVTQRIETTPVDEPLVVFVPNLPTSDNPLGNDDYQDIDPLLQEINVRLSQISRILDKHADPHLAGPTSALEYDEATGQYIFRTSGSRYFPLQQGDPEPKYITWDGQLSAAFEELDRLMELLYLVSETSPAAFGQLKAGLAESGSALKRLMMAPLRKTQRIASHLEPALRKALLLASQLDAAVRGMPVITDVHITWQDGLPADEREEAEVVTRLYQSGLISTEAALRRLYNLDAEALEAELARLGAAGGGGNPNGGGSNAVQE
ncbi:prophage lambdach01, portal protein [Desulfofundulus kuznetsovii DSM 6115]|uniref:Prophage lambdach01, portal protein n=1 Tax=Desulfofundulus kuznetsovii (strain DSM 6115 / VKM B-1805 / 17) TaxID=760568 RepID=A0AAU8PUT3_DESK7|nr:prophage lambdach01, portal protein [Desulfofundulus kuznetsovii DSM 6115]